MRRAAEDYARVSASRNARGVKMGSSPASASRCWSPETIGGAVRWCLGVGREPHCLAQKLDKRAGLVFCDALVDLRIGERSCEFGEERLRDDELELAGDPTRDDLCRRSASGEE